MIAMNGTKRAAFAAMAVTLLCGLMTGCRYRSAACKQRGVAFNAQVNALERDAIDKLKIGTKKEDVIRFFAENKFPITFDRSFATGTIFTLGCSPNGCGTDQAVIGLSVDLDEAGSVKAKPVVVGGYADCL
ncbi:MAG: hypothetical protein WCG81_20835 [Candidatus Angelobacter sp.]